jgi:hydroxyethylthiazole kinase
MHGPNADLPNIAAELLRRVRERAPRVHCLTNAVAQNFTANAVLAIGAIPSMTIAPTEIGDFVRRANALLINLGTFDEQRTQAAELAIAAAKDAGIPWLLDPVFIDRSPLRAAFARDIAARGAAALRLNAAEFAALTERAADEPTVLAYARSHGSIVAMTGAADLVTDGTRTVTIANGDALMGQVTAMGDALSAVVGACLAAEPDRFNAVAGALLAFGVAGEIAAKDAHGPGTFAVAMIDALHALDREALQTHARLA